MTLYDRLAQHARTQPDKTAIECDDGPITYQQLHVLVDRCIVNFESLGLHTGDRVAMQELNQTIVGCIYRHFAQPISRRKFMPRIYNRYRKLKPNRKRVMYQPSRPQV